MGKRIAEPAENPSLAHEAEVKKREAKKPCRICTKLDPEGRPTIHDKKWLHTDTNKTERKIRG